MPAAKNGLFYYIFRTQVYSKFAVSARTFAPAKQDHKGARYAYFFLSRISRILRARSAGANGFCKNMTSLPSPVR